MSFAIHNPVEHYFQVSELHRIRVLEAGNPSGPCVLFVHGGPGSGVNTDWIDYLNCEHYRVILIDQRGAGKSTPLGELAENTLTDLINDIELVRQQLNVENWYITGGSWGSVVALSYAIKFPHHTLGLIIRGVFLGSRSEIDWLYAPGGASRFYPDVWARFTLNNQLDNQVVIFKHYLQALNNKHAQISQDAAYRWMEWASISMFGLPDFNALSPTDLKKLQAKARIMCHYLSQNCFLPSEDFIISSAHLIKTIPTWVIQGRADLICPPDTIWRFAQAHGNTRVKFLEGIGHAPAALETREALRDIFESLKR